VLAAPPNHLAWSDWVAWIEIGIAVVLLFLTAQVWLLLVGAFAFRGFVYGVMLLIAGKEIFAPFRPIPRVEAAAGAFFALTTLLLLSRFIETRPSILDRIALTFYVLAAAFAFFGHRAASTLIDPWLIAGWIGLAVSWCVHRWKTTKARTPEAQLSREISAPR
jgi:hypothetical protein